MRGRKPKPIEQRIREGNPSKTPMPEVVVIGGTPPAPPEPPDYLEPDAKEFWAEAVPVLHKVGLLDTVDRAALEMTATAYARFRGAGRIIAAQGVLTRGASGQLIEHPAVSTERNAMQQFLRLAEQYALTPVARTRLGMAELQRKSLADDIAGSIGAPDLVPADE